MLKTVFCNGLNPEVLTKLACHDDQVTLDSLIDLTICLDCLILSCHPALCDGAVTAPKNLAERMQLGRAWLNEAEQEQCCREFRCFYCRQDTRHIRQCPLKFHRDTGESMFSTSCSQSVSPSQLFSPQAFILPVIVECSGISSVLTALIDCGAAGNFIDHDRAQKINIPV